MTDAAVAAQLQRECKVRLRISHQELQQLLAILERSYRVYAPLRAIQEQQPAIDPNYFANSFAPDKGFFFYADPFLAERDETTPKFVLARQDIIDLFYSILEAIDRRELGDTSKLTTEQTAFLRRVKNGLDNSKDKLEKEIPLFAQTLSTIEHTQEDDKTKEPELEYDIPEKLKALIRSDFSLAVNWPYIKQLVTDAEKTRYGTDRIVTSVDNQPVQIFAIKLRRYLNKWLKELYSDSFKKLLDMKQVEFPKDPVYYFSTEDATADIDIDEWNEDDSVPGMKTEGSAPPTQFILYVLGEKIAEFLKAKDREAPPAYVSQSTESAENDSNVTKDKKEDEQLTLLEKFDKAGISYATEANRLTAILLPQFFSSHGIFSRGLNDLERFDPVDFLVVEREFRAELENVLRSLRPEEFALLNERGAQLEFRYLILKKLYGKLSTNPRFIGSIHRYRDEYIKQLPPGQARELEKILNMGDERFDDLVYNGEKNPQTEWGDGFKAVGSDREKELSVLPLQNLSGLNSLTAEDLKVFIKLLSKGEQVDFDALLRNLDVLISERWSPEQVRGISVLDAEVILGIKIPASIANNPTAWGRFCSLTAEYLYARRQRLADHYELDVISREKADQRDQDGSLKSYTPEALAALKATQALAEEHKDAGGGEAVILARSADSSRVEDYKSGGHKYAKTVSTIHGNFQKEGDEKIKAEHEEQRQRFGEMSIDQKRELLASLGFLTNEIVDVKNDEARQNFLLQQKLDQAHAQRYAEFLQDNKEFSYFEQEDDEVVTSQSGVGGAPGSQPPHIERYGRPTGARSLMKGALNIKKTFNKTKKDADFAKSALKFVDNLSDKGEAALLTPVMGPLAQNKWVRRGIVGAIGLLAAKIAFEIYKLFTTGGFLTQAGAVLGGIAGGFAGGSAAAFFTAGTLPIVGLGTGGGALLGAYGGAKAGYAIEEFFGAHPKASLNLPGIGGGSATANATATAANTNQAGFSTSLGTAISATGTVAYVTGSAVVFYSSLIGGLQPPPLGTIGSDGLESPYVNLIKTAREGDRFPNSALPGSVTYEISIEAKEGYSIEVTGLKDEFSIKTNDSKRGSEVKPPVPSCPDITFANLQNKVVAKDGTPQPGENEDGRLVVGECHVNFDTTYHDVGVLNQFSITFNATPLEGGGPAITNQTAETAEIVCFGDCPQFQTGGWPTHGKEVQGPYGSFSHKNTDAIDFTKIASDPDNVIIYSTFPGTAWFFQGASTDPAKKGVHPNYGNHVVLVTDDGFVLLFGHLREFSSQFTPGQSYPIEPCTQLGIMGTTGFSTGVHLHYEYRVYAGRSWYSYAAGGRRILETHTPKPYSEGDIVSSDCGPATK